MLAKLPCGDFGAQRRPAPPKTSAGARWALAAAILGSTVASLDATAVNVSLPTIQRELAASSAAVQWIVEGYALFVAALILTGGALGDRFGRRLVFALGALLFAAASLWCGLSGGIETLVAARCVQGLAAALLIPGSLALIAAAFDESSRGAAIGTWAGLGALSSAAGPPLGGWLTQAFSWRWIFLINVPIAFAVAIVAMLRVAESADKQAARQFDVPGAVLATLGLGGVTYGFVQLQAPGASPAVNAGSILLGAGFLLAFARVQLTARSPMIPRALVANKLFVAANVYTFVLYAALGAAFYFLPFDLQFVRGFSPLESGLALLPLVAVMGAGSRFTGALFSRNRAPLALALGPVAAACGFFLIALAGSRTSYWASYFPATILLGIGTAVFVAPLTTLVMNAAAKHAGAGSGVNNAVSRTGGLLAVAVAGAFVWTSFQSTLADRIAAGGYSQAARRAVALSPDRVAALEIPDGVPTGERDRLRNDARSAYVRAFGFAMAACGLVCVLAALYARFAIRLEDENTDGARFAASR